MSSDMGRMTGLLCIGQELAKLHEEVIVYLHHLALVMQVLD